MPYKGKTFDDNGKYRTDDGDLDQFENPGQASLRVDPKNVKGLDIYQEGDDVELIVKAKVGKLDEEGLMDMQVIRVRAQDMEPGARGERQKMMSEAPSMAGTDL